uniref:Nephrocystin 3-like N-terminal domain-containing protein n=1 Tax=Latimeria chalumnae TaxID=7897 RepID=H3AUK9_LATCH
DTEPERHALIEKVYPSLYRFCKEKGYEFRMFDLRWGVKDGVSNSNNLMALHLETLKQCQESEGLNFVVIIVSFYRTVLLDRFQSNAPKSAVEYEKDTGLLCQWYKLDENSIPGVYRLQPVRSVSITHLRSPFNLYFCIDYLSDVWKIFFQLQSLYFCTRCGKKKKIFQYKVDTEYRVAVLQREVDQGLTQDPPEEHCYWFKRNITDIKYNLSSEKAFEYIDILPRQPEINQERYAAHQIFINNTLAKKLRYTNICEYTVCWGRNGIDPLVNRSHSYYIEQVCSDFQKAVLNQLNKSVLLKRKEAFQNYIKQEILEHFIFCLSRAKSFMGRQPVLLDLKDRVWFSNRKVIVVHGETGSGKSTIIAKAALLANGWIPGSQIVVRFVGVTGESRNIRLLLQSLCFQIAEIYDVPANFSEDFHELLNEFISLLEFATENKPLMLWLDGLDELSVDYGTNILWLPSELP